MYSLSTAELAAGAKADAEAQNEARAKNVFMMMLFSCDDGRGVVASKKPVRGAWQNASYS